VRRFGADMSRFDFYDREDRPWPNARLTNAAIVGHTTTDSTRLWVRVYEPGTYSLIVSDKRIDTLGQPRISRNAAKLVPESGKPIPLPGRVQSRDIDFSTDLTTVFDVTGLEAGKTYHYAVFARPSKSSQRNELWEIGRDEPHTFTTQSAAAANVTFGLFSCHMPYPDDRGIKNMEMWLRFRHELEDGGAHFIIGAGDQVYTDGTSYLSIWRWLKKIKNDLAKINRAERVDIMKSWFRDIYRGYWGDLELRRVFRNFPTYTMWDDHEIMDGWGSYTKKELSELLDTIWEFEDTGKNLQLADDMRTAAGSVYEEYQHCRNPPTVKGAYDYAFSWGFAALYVLDMRGQRDYERKSDDRILGAAQFQRLESWLAGLDPAATRAVFIVSPVPVVHTSSFIVNYLDLSLLGLNDDLRDSWEHASNWKERDKLLDLVFSFSQQSKLPIAFLSGDVHIGAAFRLSRNALPDARVYQLTSSAITYAKAPGGLLKLAVRENGTLESATRTTFHCLHAFSRNNFGIVRLDATKDPARISWDLYGSSSEPGEIVKLKRVELG